MASPKKRLPENAPGNFFVDSTCIDCDTCRQIAPQVFAQGDEYAFVHRQPSTDAEGRLALYVLVSCPTGSIGSLGDDKPGAVRDDFPPVVEEPVFYCGWVLPGHGQRVHLPAAEMRHQMKRLVRSMRGGTPV